MLKKGIILMLLIIILVTGAGYLGRNIILKKYIENKVEMITGEKVTIKKVSFQPFAEHLEINDIKISNEKNENKDLMTIETVKVNYKMSILKKTLNVLDSSIFGVNLMPAMEEKRDLTQKTTAENGLNKDSLEESKKIVNDEINKILTSKYSKLKEKFEIDKKQIEEELKSLGKSTEYIETKKNVDEIFKSKNPLAIFEKNPVELENLKKSVEKLSKLLSSEKDRYEKSLNKYNIKKEFDDEINKKLSIDIAIGKEGIKNFDALFNTYLNEQYEPKVYEVVKKYQEFVRKIKELKIQESTNKSGWKFEISNLLVTLNAYEMDFNGSITGISNKFSDNMEEIIFRLVGIESISEDLETVGSVNNGVIEGKINLNDMKGQITINIPEGKLEHFDNIKNYINDGYFGINGSIVLDDENITISGDGNLQKMELTPKIISEQLKVDIFFLEGLFLGMIKETSVDDIKYSYNSVDRKIIVNSNLGIKILTELEKDDKKLEKEIIQKLKQQVEEKVKEYVKQLEDDKSVIKKDVKKSFEHEFVDIERMNKVLERIKIKDKNGILDRILKKFQ
ncbi:hypothetical protein [Fusobacterium sp. PH5-44]|uniref:hypothetical protein n=1 Tax=unclassified Fusobacterium TaxID=2648384 RepID=UPI003D1988A7